MAQQAPVHVGTSSLHVSLFYDIAKTTPKPHKGRDPTDKCRAFLLGSKGRFPEAVGVPKPNRSQAKSLDLLALLQNFPDTQKSL